MRTLIIDDDRLECDFLADLLKSHGATVVQAASPTQGADLSIYDIVLVKPHFIDHLPTDRFIVICATATEARAVRPHRSLIKPFSPAAIIHLMKPQKKRSAIIAESDEMKRVLTHVAKVGRTSATVFLTGESGTGKEVIAAAIHQASTRADKPYIRVNCAAIPEALVESEFFGHEKGAYTGAISNRVGRFELANNGTLLLDEVSEFPLHLQPKLLRVVQEREFERVGGTKLVEVDVRLIATSNVAPDRLIADGILRQDLYYRLNVFPFHIPPLRQRQCDILPLANYFLDRFCEAHGQALKKLSPQAQKQLFAHAWPGNIRELANVIERAVILEEGSEITEPLIDAP